MSCLKARSPHVSSGETPVLLGLLRLFKESVTEIEEYCWVRFVVCIQVDENGPKSYSMRLIPIICIDLALIQESLSNELYLVLILIGPNSSSYGIAYAAADMYSFV
ncbi:unnamed protein product [Arabidopsis halleri]